MTPDEIKAAMKSEPEPTMVPPTEEESAVLAALPAHSDTRAESLLIALRAGADAPTLVRLAQAYRLARGSKIVLPARYGNTSRGKGWARLGTGAAAEWGDRVAGGNYEVGTAGHWVVQSSDGFNRSSRVEWDVEHVTVGDMTWTIAS